jgi:hypothetical protein
MKGAGLIIAGIVGAYLFGRQSCVFPRGYDLSASSEWRGDGSHEASARKAQRLAAVRAAEKDVAIGVD